MSREAAIDAVTSKVGKCGRGGELREGEMEVICNGESGVGVQIWGKIGECVSPVVVRVGILV